MGDLMTEFTLEEMATLELAPSDTRFVATLGGQDPNGHLPG